MAEHVIAPELFELIDEYASDLDAGVAIVDDVVPATSPGLVFAESAFAQFFENVVGEEIHGFDDKAKRKAARTRVARRNQLSKPALSLIALFKQFCDSYDDVRSASYGGQAQVLEDFHEKLIVRLIERVGALAKDKGDEKLQASAESSLDHVRDMIAGYDWQQHEGDEDDEDDE